MFKPGHRIRVDVSSSDFPFFESNRLRSTSRVHHDSDQPSRMVLPVVRR